MSLRSKLTIVILALVSIPLVFVSIISFSNYEDSLETARFSQLENLADFKADRIEAYFAGLKTEIEMAQNFYIIRKHLPVLIRSGDSRSDPLVTAARNVLDKQLRGIQASAGLFDIILADKMGRIVYSSDSGNNPTTMFTALPKIQLISFKEGLNRISFSEIFLNEPAGNRPEMLISAPAFDLNDTVIGIIVFEMDMAPLFQIVQDTTGLGTTGEILIGKKFFTNEIRYLNPLRHDPGTVLKRIIHAGDTIALPIQNAVRGETGTGRSIDYRGKKVVAAWRYIPSLKWGLVAKIDSAEAFEVVSGLRRLLILVLAVVFSMVSIITLSMARSISRPIQMLSQGAAIIGSGNLDHKVGTTLKDEIGQLSRSFDKMTHDLKAVTASRNELDREITVRKQAEERLRESEERFKAIAEATPVGIGVVGLPEAIFLYVNPAYIKSFGYTRSELLGKGTPDIYWSIEDRNRILEILKETGSIAEYEVMLKRKDGTPFWGLSSVRPITYNGRPALLGAFVDITERKQAEKKLRETTDYLDKLIQFANAPIVVWDPELHITRFNRGFEKLTGCMERELLGENISQLFPEKSCDASLQKIETALKGAQLDLVEIPILCKNGDIKIALWNSANIYAENGTTLLATIAQGMDITERKQIEVELAEKRLLLENLVRKQGKVIIDTKENLDLETRERLRVEQELTHRQQALEAVYAMATAFNSSFAAMNDQVALNIAKILNIPIATIYYFLEDRVSIGSLFFKGELVRRNEEIIPCAECRRDIFNSKEPGSSINFHKHSHHAACFPNEKIKSYIGVPILNHQGKVLGMICALDSVERSFDEYEVRLVEIFARYLSHEQSQRELESQLVRANEMKILGQLTSGVAHEVRNPLNGIMAIIGALSKEIGDAERFQPYMQHLRNQVTRLTTLMEDLLALGRPVREENKIEMSIVDLVEKALSSWQSGLEKPREVRFETPRNVKQDLMVRADGIRIEQIIVNLLENAHQHSPQDNAIVLLVENPLPTMVVISVRDYGPGIANEIMPRIFEPFFTTRKSGTGLGLSIVRHIVESHGGAITAHNNTDGPGVTFTINLPLSRTAM
jgi:PAS domain S-box-containing protein